MLPCATIGCPYRAHSTPIEGFNGYCCILCAESGNHGPRCERASASQPRIKTIPWTRTTYNTDPDAAVGGATCTTASLVNDVACGSPDPRRSLETLSKVVSNVLKNPQEAKFRELKKENKAVRSAILDVKPCFTLLRRCGFEDKGEVLRLQSSGLRPGEVARIAMAMGRIDELVDVAANLGGLAATLGAGPAQVSDPLPSTPANGKGSSTPDCRADMPPLLYGTAWREERTTELVVQAVKCGFRGIDTALQTGHYREDLVGLAVRQLAEKHGIARSSLFIQTKFTPLRGHDPANVPYDQNASLAQQVEQSFQQSLKNLGVDYLDAYLVHECEPTIHETLQVWGAMENIYRRGGAKRIGVTNCHDLAFFRNLCESAQVPPMVLQNQFICEAQYDVELRNFCKLRGVQYQPFWVLCLNQHLLSGSAVTSASRRMDLTPAQVLLNFLSRSEGTYPVTGPSSADHMRQALFALSGQRSLDEGEEIFIRSMLR